MTFGPDGPCAVQAARALRRLGVPHYLVEDGRHPLAQSDRDAAKAEGATVLAGLANRNGNLNGRAYLAAQLRTLRDAAAATDAEWALKVDSDAVVRRLDWLRSAQPHHAAACFLQSNWFFQGPCYALRASAIPAMLDLLEHRPAVIAHMEPKVPEDCATAALATAAYGPHAIHSVPGWPGGNGIAHWQFKFGAEFDLVAPFDVVVFGNRLLLPKQMPDAYTRAVAARAMRLFQDRLDAPPAAG